MESLAANKAFWEARPDMVPECGDRDASECHTSHAGEE